MTDETGAKDQAPAAYDDHPVKATGPAAAQAPLVAFAGAEPPAPDWFKAAIAIAPERIFVESLGTKLEVLTWGEVGKPGLLLVHGNSAHADWWSFIAPFFAEAYRVAAVSLAGMGASDWRDTYSFGDFGQDAEAVAQAAGLYAGDVKPVYIGHSFGGGQVLYAASRFPQHMRAAILIDTGFGPPPEEEAARRQQVGEVRNIPTTDRASRVYPTLEAALGRFRLMPQQPVTNVYIADFIARRSLKRAPLEDGSGEGWTWRFDPNMWTKLDRTQMSSSLGVRYEVTVPLVHIYGADSVIMTRRAGGQPTPFPEDMPEVEIPDSHHHVLIDQPLALVSAIRALLAVWPAAKTPDA